ncbi:hypothetical protein HPB47_012734 [Ixodes persulcatus]|uniref:Uncharacterized protein n=1 Tax=Ixodes persulcatus TaxID=34615 RepID=A0AC60NSP7_IXOPE|nr:hypothetical protein HPB47_012734 [Ixodes persulcatus]
MAENLTQASDASPSTMQGIPTVAATDKSATSQLFTFGSAPQMPTTPTTSSRGTKGTSRATAKSKPDPKFADTDQRHLDLTAATTATPLPEDEKMDDEGLQSTSDLINASEHLFGPTLPSKREKFGGPSETETVGHAGTVGPHKTAPTPPEVARMSHLQAEWSARDPSSDRDNDQGTWSAVVSRGTRRKAIAPAPLAKQVGKENIKITTVILRPRERIKVSDISPRDLKSGIAKTTGDFTYERGYQIRVQNFSNTVAVDIWQPHLVDHFLDLTSINTPTKDIPIQAFHAVGGDQVRGVIYGIDPNEDPEQLLPNLASTTHWILAARPMGKNSKTALVTFEGNRIPRRVWYHNIVRRVFPYRPKAVVCTHCHRIGHKSDICPNAQEQRCPDCGREHILTDGGCEETTPQCRNCGKAHLATDSSCQKWRDANKQLRIKAKPKRKSTNTKAPAGQTGQSQTTTTPKENTAEQSLPKSTAKRKATNLAPPPPPLADEHFPVLPQHEGSESKPSKGQGDHRVDQLADEMRKALKAPRKQTPPQHPDKPAPGRQPGRTTHTDQQQERLQSPAEQITNNRNKTVAFTSQSSQADIRPNFTLDDIRDIIRQEIKEILRTELPNMINPIVHEVVHALLQRQTTSLATTNINPPSNPNQHGHS